jgi:hypothetical protein
VGKNFEYERLFSSLPSDNGSKSGAVPVILSTEVSIPVRKKVLLIHRSRESRAIIPGFYVNPGILTGNWDEIQTTSTSSLTNQQFLFR